MRASLRTQLQKYKQYLISEEGKTADEIIRKIRANQPQTLSRRTGAKTNGQAGSNGNFNLFDEFMDAASIETKEKIVTLWSRYIIQKEGINTFRLITPRTSHKVFYTYREAELGRNKMAMDNMRHVFIYPWRDSTTNRNM